MHPFAGSVVSPLLSPPSSEYNSSSKSSISDPVKERQETYKTTGGQLSYPLSPMSNSTPPLPYRSSYPSTSASNGIATRSPVPDPYASQSVQSSASVSRLGISTESPAGRISPPRDPNHLPPVTPSGYRPHPEYSSPTSQRPDSQSSYFPSHQSPRQQPFSPPQQPPRRAKAHVPSACVNCKNAHLACDVQRPCPRCISTGKQDSCVDVEHKKRGRPRLRDVRHSFEVARAIDSRSGLNLGGRLPSPGPPNGRGMRLPGPERVGRTSISSRTAPYVLSDPARQEYASRPLFTEPLPLPRGQALESSQYIPPTAFLTTDLVVASSTGSFQDLLGFAAHDLNLRRTVYDLATDSPTDLKNLDRVLRCIRAIIQREDPHYRTPPSQEVYNVLQRSSSVDLRAGLRGAPVIEEYFDFRRSDSAVIKGFARFYLSRASVYFVAMEVGVVRNRSFTGPSTNRVPEAPNFPQIPHRGSADSILPQRLQRSQSFSSPNFTPQGQTAHQSSPAPPVPAVPALPVSRGMGVPSPALPPASTYPPPAPAPVPGHSHGHRRDRSIEIKQQAQQLHAPSSMSSLRQYSVSSSSYSSIDTRNSPASILSPGVGPIYASPTELTPRTEHIQLPPLRGLPAVANLQNNREQENRGLGIQLSSERDAKGESGVPEQPVQRRGRIGVREIVE
ncbi:hypothetical protein H072_10515 [Dactylellina haptotyla CBS 200.50]|uniref:Zn(2)-C6 fungal-type domain-containing protein n=1 Tax=Dactylellina haptotyla (strain CBS 200.50) TaxID=1284197 RepID=S7ZZZ3_DACHA|nr:hypothetical protein H072_10515 [Dactylellina haptotyla CBS 200.50]